MSRPVAVVPHTHWDREWYAPFESYRAHLLAMMDGLLDLMESDDGPDRFHLDGQVAMVDDYVETRPAAADRIRRLVTAGRLAIGPWYVLMDEFCVSAETIVRNLQLGMERAASLGAAAPYAGYLPDMFGHTSQMPQVLRRAGIDHAVVWRGVPSAIEHRAFWWAAPDGSRVRAEYLPVGYASGAFLPKEAAALVRRMAAHEEEIAAFIGAEGPILLMNGGDHQAPQEWLPEVLKDANAIQDHFHFRQTGLIEFLDWLASRGEEDLPVWRGELRSGARAPILMGVLSNRVDIKQAAAAAEAALERQAEPLAALWLPPELWPEEQLDRAWLQLIRNSAHDSICACSADPVGRAVLERYDSALAIASEVIRAAGSIAGVATEAAGPVLVNPSPLDRCGVVELLLPGAVVPARAQQLGVIPEGTEVRRGRGRDLGTILGGLARDGWLGADGRGVEAELAAVAGEGGGEREVVLTIRSDASRTPDPAMAPVMAEAWAAAGAGRDRPLTVRVERAAVQKVAVRVADVPGWGWAVWRPEGVAVADVVVADRPGGPDVVVADVVVADRPGGPEMSNGLCSVVVDGSTGTFSLNGVVGQNRIVEEGDEGDTYNFSPAARPAEDRTEDVQIHILERGPVRAAIRVVRRYPWDGGTTVVSDLQLECGETAVRVTTSFNHVGRDHRIRAVFPVGGPAMTTAAEAAFEIVERGEAEGGPQEQALATYPSRRFVTAGRLTVTHQGLLEYELVGDGTDGGTELAVTLLRATGVLSRPAPPARPNVAGPPLPLRDTQMPGPQTFRYALAVDCSDPYALADRMWSPLVVVPADGHGHLPDLGSRLPVHLGRAQVSSLRRRGGAIEMRVFNPGASATRVEVPSRSGTLVNLAGGQVGDWDEGFDVAPGEIVTARLRDVSLD